MTTPRKLNDTAYEIYLTLAHGPLTTGELVHILQCQRQFISAYLRLLVKRELIRLNDRGRYEHTGRPFKRP
jgi:predicted ArsR family transcriptional regulator